MIIIKSITYYSKLNDDGHLTLIDV